MSLKTAAKAETAPRLKKPSWKDPRLLLGVLLVLGSVAGVGALVASQDQTTQVLAAAREIPVGTVLEPDDFDVVQVALGGLEGTYMPASDPFPEDAVAGSLIRRGELLARADITAAIGTQQRTGRMERQEAGAAVAVVILRHSPCPTAIQRMGEHEILGISTFWFTLWMVLKSNNTHDLAAGQLADVGFVHIVWGVAFRNRHVAHKLPSQAFVNRSPHAHALGCLAHGHNGTVIHDRGSMGGSRGDPADLRPGQAAIVADAAETAFLQVSRW